MIPSFWKRIRATTTSIRSQLLKVSQDGNTLVLDDGGRLTNAFLPLSETQFVAEDADRGFTLIRAEAGEPTGMTLRLVADEMPVQRIGPLVRLLKPVPDPDHGLTQKLEAILKAFAQGGHAVEVVEGLAPQARLDYARGPSPELSGIQSLSYLGERNLAAKGIERTAPR